MTKFLKIQSNGEIETEAFTLIGASSKRNDETKIGYYGSGLKYSISSMLRNNIGFKVFSGEREVVFTREQKEFRGEKFDVICVDGKETSLTVGMGGKDWDVAFAPIREIYSNAIDEDESASAMVSDTPYGVSGKTSFFIELTNEVAHFNDNFGLYFCNRNPNVLHSNKYATAYPKTPEGDLRLFRKGILCHHKTQTKALFSYNSAEFQINESRVLSASYSASCTLAGFWKTCTNETLIKDLVNGLQGGNAGLYEHELEWNSWQGDFSTEWKNVFERMKCVPVEMVGFCSEKELVGRVKLPAKLLKALFRAFDHLDILGLSKKENGCAYFVEENPSPILIDKVIDALAVLRKTRYAHRLVNETIVYAKFTDDDVHGMAEDGKIILSTKLDCQDVNYIAKVIIEENEHNRSGLHDETRAFQNHLFDLYFDELNAK